MRVRLSRDVFSAPDSNIRIDAQVQDVATGRVIGAETVKGDDVFVLADDLTRRLHRRLRVPERADARAIRDLTSGSVQAYRHYVDGVDARRNLREVDARAAFEQAVATDPTFALAYFPLAEVCARLGDVAAAEQYRRQGRAHLDRLPERQQLFWSADEARRRGDFAGSPDRLISRGSSESCPAFCNRLSKQRIGGIVVKVEPHGPSIFAMSRALRTLGLP